MKALSPIIFFALLTCAAFAQTNKQQPSLQDFQREMREMQQQLIQQFQQFSPDLPGEWKIDTSFSFRFDTLMNGEMSSKFFSAPFGRDTALLHNFEFDKLFRDGSDPFDGGFQWLFPPNRRSSENEENSALDDPGDGLLPEERLRMDTQDVDKAPGKPTTPKVPQSKIKTIRI
ncbi:MAG: hypothetical protein RIQ78_424 [Bacteroidota bacterium]|jgi:hypothetical protein